MIKEWADIVLFANYKTYVVEDDKTKSKKAQGGKRVMYATHNPCWDAKNRFGLADCLAFDYSEIKKVIEGMPEKTTSKKPENSGKKAEKPAEKPVEKPVEKTAAQKLKDKIVESALDEVMVRRAIAKKGAYPEETPIDDYDVSFIDNSILAKWESFKKYVEKLYAELDEVPFK